MAIKSYDAGYLDSVAVNVGTMFEYAVTCGYEPEIYWNMFVTSEVARQIEKGNPRFLVGLSASELLLLVLPAEDDGKFPPQTPFFDRSPFYWAGWALAQYQYMKEMTFFHINRHFPIPKVLALYHTIHEADITKFFAVADGYVNVPETETNLKKIRIAAGLSQRQLAGKAEVSVRNIQMYEQRHNDINRAQADILLRLSRTLGCNMEDLLEEPTDTTRAFSADNGVGTGEETL